MITTRRAVQDYFSRLNEQLVTWRRHIHANPELSFEEEQTAAYIAGEIRAMGLEPRTGVGGNGIVVDIGPADRADGARPTVLVRADIDALPVTEQTGLDFASRNEGVMHACGHDIHTTSLLGAARFFAENRESLPGTVRVIFQPAEEKLPGGARAMIADGVLQNPEPRLALGQHINPELPVGKAGFIPGQFMASVDDFHFTVKGVGGHAAHPEALVDPVVIAAQIINALQSVVSRRAPRGVPTTLSIGKVVAPGASNVIPDTVYMEGTFRTTDEEWRERARGLIEELATQTARAAGGDCEVEVLPGYPSLFNDRELTSRAREFAEEFLGEEHVVDLPLTMGAEDFAYYGHEIPGCFYNLGVTDFEEVPAPPPLHSPRLTPSERALPIGAGLLTWITLRSLETLAA